MQAEKFFSRLELVDENGESLFLFTYDPKTGKATKRITDESSVNELLLERLVTLPEGRIFS